MTTIIGFLNKFLGSLVNSSSEEYRILGVLFIYTLLIVVYASFIWKFHKIISKKEFSIINLSKYDNSEHPLVSKTILIIFLVAGYLIVFPILLLVGFIIFSLFLWIFSRDLEIINLLLISTSIIISVRIMAYVQEDISRNIAKILAFTLFTILIFNPDFFNLESLFAKISEIPVFFNEIIIFVFYIILAEFILRISYSLPKLIKYAISPRQEVPIKKKTK